MACLLVFPAIVVSWAGVFMVESIYNNIMDNREKLWETGGGDLPHFDKLDHNFLGHLERFLGAINGYGETRTSIVFSTPIARRGLVPPGGTRAA